MFRSRVGLALRITGMLMMIFSGSLLTPLPFSFYYQDGAHWDFLQTFIITLALGFMIWFPHRRIYRELRARDGFLVTVLVYLGLGFSGSLLFQLSVEMTLPWADALFESFSGITTTGATVLTNLDSLPPSVLFYRQQLQWLGGMGIIVLAVAVLPILGVGGMMLYRAETPGPVKDSKLTPRITETSKVLWYIYMGLTAACAFAYWMAGMSVFDAICHSFSTVAIGGFSTHDASLGYFDSGAVEWVAMIFMILCGINFGLHFLVLRHGSPGYYLKDPEVRFYLSMLFVVFAVCACILSFHSYDAGTGTVGEALRKASFHAVSVATTTGFTTEDFSAWPHPAPFILLFAAFVGGCAGSTAGGLKSVRMLLIFLQGIREIRMLIRPNAVFYVKLSGQNVEDRVINSVWGFLAVYLFAFVIILIIVMLEGMDFVTAFSTVGATVNNLGPALGEAAANYKGLSSLSKLTLCGAMLMGRLEIYTLLVLFAPSFWRW